MATITKPNTFTAGTTILSADVNSDFDTIYNDYNGNITNANISGSAAIVDTKLAQITTASKVSGAALASLGSIPTQTDTTTNSFLMASNSLTTGTAMTISSSATAITGAGRILYSNHTGTTSTTGIMNEFASAATDGTTVLRVTASAALAAGVVLDVTGVAVTTGTLFDCSDADALTTGFIANLVSNSASTSTRTLVKIHNDHTSADDTECLRLIQDADDFALYIDYNATVSDTITGIRIDGCDVANGTVATTMSALGPAGITTTTIAKWLVVDLGGTRHYIPCWT